jgi:TolA-binding protein
MTADVESRDDARWAELLEAEACDELSVDERSELDRLTAQSDDHRQVREVLAAIATRSTSEADLTGEDRRLIDSVIADHAQRGRRRKHIVWLAAVAVLVPLAAAAAYLPWGAKTLEAPTVTAPAMDPAVVPSVTATHGRPGEPGDQVPTAEPESTSEPAVPSAAPSPSTAAPPSAAELLARAQKARSAREHGAAIRAYQQLLRLHPRSGEARLAQVSLAQLQLAQGNAAAALSGFDAYQRTGGALSQEAHYGKIQALHALGRTAEERAESRRFLERYPKSLQAATLRRRLGVGGDQD